MTRDTERSPARPDRRRAIGMIAVLAAPWPLAPWLPARASDPRTRRELGLHEADFYRPHDLAG